jgi:hypothetical protein
MASAKACNLQFKISIRLIGERRAILDQFFHSRSDFEARDRHGEFWNARFAHSDRFRSSLYGYSTNKRRWLRLETIS